MVPVTSRRVLVVILLAGVITGLLTWRLAVSPIAAAMFFSSSSPPPSPLPTPTPRPSAPPIVTAVSPDHSASGQAAHILIYGSGFYGVPTVKLGEHALTDVRKLNTALLKATVPAGLPAGSYDVRVCNPDGQCAALPGGYRILGAEPILTSLLPNMGYNNAASPLTVRGYNLHPGITLKIANVALTDVDRRSSTEVWAVVPAGLPVGAQDVKACNPDGQCDTLHNGYVVLSRSGNDLSVADDDIWTLPATLREGDLAQLGANIHRDGGTGVIEPAVAFYRGNPANGGVLIGSMNLPPMDPGAGVVESAVVDWDTTGVNGTVQVYVVVDPAGAVSETTKANNTAHRTVTILPANADTVSPRVSNVRVNGGATLTTGPQITVTLNAADNPGGSGVQSMYLVEREFNSAARMWAPVQRTGWIAYQPTLAMTLTGQGGLRYIQVRVADAAGNISEGARAFINYLPPVSRIWAMQAHVYRQRLTTGQQISVTLNTLSGDADLFIWQPGGGLAGRSLNNDLTPDTLTLTAERTGDYQIEVWGWLAHPSSTYNLNIAVGPEGTVIWPNLRAPMAAEDDEKDGAITEPVLPTSEEPQSNSSIPPAPIRGVDPRMCYVPLIMHNYAPPITFRHWLNLPTVLNGVRFEPPPPVPGERKLYLPLLVNGADAPPTG